MTGMWAVQLNVAPKCETCQDTQWSYIVETDDGDFIEDVCPDCADTHQQADAQ